VGGYGYGSGVVAEDFSSYTCGEQDFFTDVSERLVVFKSGTRRGAPLPKLVAWHFDQ